MTCLVRYDYGDHMVTVNVSEAKTHLSALLDRAVRGEEIVIARHGRPVVRLTPAPPVNRQPGVLKGRLTIDWDEFDAADAAVATLFQGEE